MSVAPAELLARADDDARLSAGSRLKHVHRRAGGEAESLALADGQPMQAAMPAERRAPPLSTISPVRSRVVRAAARQSPPASPSGTKQISWLSGLSATSRPSRARVRADLGLRQVADRKHRVRELVLRQREQEIRLVLVAVDAAQQPVPPRVLVELDARVVAGGDGRGVEARPRAPTSVENFRSALQCTHGIGVRPAAYSATKLSTTVA